MAKKGPDSSGEDDIGAQGSIGYGRPPRHSQFKPGQSGNPRGRPKGSKSRATILRRILNEKISFREGDRMKRVSKYEGIHRTQVHKALKGDSKAYKAILDMIPDDPAIEQGPPLLQFIFTDEKDNEQK